MAFAPQVRSQIITRGTTASATPVINLPATVSAGDTLFVVFRCAVAGAVTWPDANWHELLETSADASDDQMAVAWKLAVGTEGGSTITLGSGNGKFAACAWAIQDAGDPNVTPPNISADAIGAATEPNALTVTPAGGSKSYLFLSFYGMEGEQTGVTAYPTGYTLGQLFADSGTAAAVTTNVTVAGAAKRLVTPAASDDASVWDVTGTLDDWCAYTVAFHPVILTDTVKVSDTATAGIPGPPLDVTLEEDLTLDDVGNGAIDLLGVIHVVDTVTAAIASNDLDVVVADELVRVADTVSTVLDALETSVAEALTTLDQQPINTLLNPLESALTEGVTPVDVVSVAILIEAALADESVRVVDTATLTIDPEEASVTDAVGLAETTDVLLNPLETALSDPVTVADGAALTTLDALETAIGENVTVADAAVDALREPLEAALVEAVTVGDTTVIGTFDPIEISLVEEVKVADTVSAGTDLLGATLSEAVVVSDAPFVTLNPLELIALEGITADDDDLPQALIVEQSVDLDRVVDAETVLVADALAVDLPVLEAAIVEAIATQDAQPIETTLDALETALVEGVTLVDTVSAVATLEAVLADESVLVADAAALTLDPEEASVTEAITLAETLDTELTLLEVLLLEGVTPADSVTAQFALAATLADESVRVADTATLSLNPEDASIAEAVGVADIVADATLDPLQASLLEGVTPQDTLSAGLDVSTALVEAVTVADTLTVLLPEEAAAPADEAIGVTDTLSVELTTLLVSAQEDLRLSDDAQATREDVGALSVNQLETVKGSDALAASRFDVVPAVSDYIIAVWGECPINTSLPPVKVPSA